MLLNKKGDWDNTHGSWLYFFGGLIFLYISLMPFFNKFPFEFEVGGMLLRAFIAIAGIIIFIESFTMESIDNSGKIGKIVIGLLFAAIGVYLFSMHIGASWVPFSFSLNEIILQIILIIYAAYLFVGAWRQ